MGQPPSTCYCIALRKASRRLTARYDAALEPLGISLAQFSLLRMIARRPGISLTALSEVAELDRSTVGRNVKLLERLGLVAPSPGSDQRESLLDLTIGGKALFSAAVPIWEAVQAEIAGRLGPDHAAALAGLLRVI